MSKDNNIKNFTGADIEKYHRGLLSAKEKHDLEKAALDDPFLADALEGYAVAGVDHTADMNELGKRLSEKVETAKVITMKTGGKSSFPWLRAAAMVILFAGAGLLAKQLFFTRHSSNDIAQAEPQKTGETKATDTNQINKVVVSSTTDSIQTKNGTRIFPSGQNEKTFTVTTRDSTPGAITKTDVDGQGNITTGGVTPVTINTNQPVVTAPKPAEESKRDVVIAPASNADIKEIAKDGIKDKQEKNHKKNIDREEDNVAAVSPGNDERQNKGAVTTSRKVNEEQYYRNQVSNTFRGRVTDANNVGLPFAKVYNANDNNAGTYTDASGNFNITYPDSVLTVQVRSLGFENTHVQLRNNVPENQVILQDDKSLSEVVISNQKPNAAARNRMANKKLEEPEPADGWDKYDTYLTNNLNVPEELKSQQVISGQVEVSFEVDKNGEPVNFKIVKSLCRKCDKEAIRLIKEGPKWKRNAKNGRTTVTISF